VLMPAILFIAALLVLGIVFGRMLMRRDAERKRAEYEAKLQSGDTTKPAGKKRRMTRRERILATLEPAPEIPTIIDLMHEEARDTGVNEIAGGEGLEVPVKLKVWQRDGGPHTECPRQSLHFEIAAGVSPEQATVEDVRLHCREPHPAAPSPAPERQPEPEPPFTESEPPEDDPS